MNTPARLVPLTTAALVTLAAALLYALWPTVRDDAPRSGTQTPPWEVTTTPDGGSRVFGIELGRSTLAEARRQVSNDLAIALIAAPDGTLALEGHSERIEAGFITGTLTLGTAVDADVLQAMRQRAVKSTIQPSGARRLALHADDQAAALAAPVVAITFVPALQLDAAMIADRFGPPAETLRREADIEHLLYPAIGLDVAINARGREVFQYVRPDAFARLRAPLTPP